MATDDRPTSKPQMKRSHEGLGFDELVFRAQDPFTSIEDRMQYETAACEQLPAILGKKQKAWKDKHKKVVQDLKDELHQDVAEGLLKDIRRSRFDANKGKPTHKIRAVAAYRAIDVLREKDAIKSYTVGSEKVNITPISLDTPIPGCDDLTHLDSVAEQPCHLVD